MARFVGVQSARQDTYQGRLDRMGEAGRRRGSAEAKLFMLALGRTKFQPHQVHDWLSKVVAEGRAELEAQHATDREIETWDVSCRMMFLLIAWRDWTQD